MCRSLVSFLISYLTPHPACSCGHPAGQLRGSDGDGAHTLSRVPTSSHVHRPRGVGSLPDLPRTEVGPRRVRLVCVFCLFLSTCLCGLHAFLVLQLWQQNSLYELSVCIKNEHAATDCFTLTTASHPQVHTQRHRSLLPTDMDAVLLGVLDVPVHLSVIFLFHSLACKTVSFEQFWTALKGNRPS